MATRFRKSRRQRGTRYCGWGQIGQHRQSGSRGGVGQAGKHKHFWIRTVKEEPNHFGHDQFNSFNRNIVKKWINLKEIDILFMKFGKKENNQSVIDLTSLGYDKLLGSGSVSGSYIIKVDSASNHAIEKIKAKGGEVIFNEQNGK